MGTTTIETTTVNIPKGWAIDSVKAGSTMPVDGERGQVVTGIVTRIVRKAALNQTGYLDEHDYAVGVGDDALSSMAHACALAARCERDYWAETGHLADMVSA